MSVLNLRLARKRKDKAAAAKQAEASRSLHGLSAAQRKTAKLALETQTRALDGHKLDKTR